MRSQKRGAALSSVVAGMLLIFGNSLGSTAGASATLPDVCTAGFHPVAMPDPTGAVRGLSVASDTDVWAVGNTGDNDASQQPTATADHWDGTAWTTAVVPHRGVATSLSSVVALSATDAWAVGYAGRSAWDPPSQAPLIAHWDGSTWDTVAQPVGQGALTAVAARGPSDVWAVGHAWTSTPQGGYGHEAPIVEHWDGSSWQAASAGPAEVAFYSASIDATGNLLAVGYTYNPSQGVASAVVYRYDGQTWQLEPVSVPGATSSYLWGVATSPNGEAWAVGRKFVGNQSALIVHWDGAVWSEVPTPSLPVTVPTYGGNELRSVSANSAHDVWAVGYNVVGAGGPYGPATHTLIEHWDGSTWSLANAPRSDDQSEQAGHTGLEAVSTLPNGRVWVAGHVNTPTVVPIAETLCEVNVTATGFAPARTSADVAATVAWRFPTTNTGWREIRDGSVMRLFDSGRRSPGDSFTFTPPGAGTYFPVDVRSGRAGTLEVGMTAVVNSASDIYVRWGFAQAAADCACFYEVQVRVPGSHAFVPFQPADTGTGWFQAPTATQPGIHWVPSDGPGMYQFRSRYHSGPGTTGWSPTLSVEIS